MVLLIGALDLFFLCDAILDFGRFGFVSIRFLLFLGGVFRDIFGFLFVCGFLG